MLAKRIARLIHVRRFIGMMPNLRSRSCSRATLRYLWVSRRTPTLLPYR